MVEMRAESGRRPESDRPFRQPLHHQTGRLRIPWTNDERAFELDLPAVVRGRDARAEEFVEPARLSSVSAEEASLVAEVPGRARAPSFCSPWPCPGRSSWGSPFRLALSGTVQDVHPAPSPGRSGPPRQPAPRPGLPRLPRRRLTRPAFPPASLPATPCRFD